jgi:hypothetical protein
MNKTKAQSTKMPRFLNEDEEAKWWASAKGREFLKHQALSRNAQEAEGIASRGQSQPHQQCADRAPLTRA